VHTRRRPIPLAAACSRYTSRPAGVVWARTWVSIMDDGEGGSLAIAHIEDVTEQRHNAERDGAPPQDAWPLAGFAQVKPDEFRRAAANVEYQRTLVLAIKQRRDTPRREPCFFCRRNDVEMQTGFLRDALDECGPVAGHAAGLRGDGPCTRDTALAHLVRADADSLDGARHRSFG